MAIRLLALDIDGTLTENSESEISKRCLDAIFAAKARGVCIAIATGRSCLATRPIWNALELTGPSIQFGGAWIVDAPSGEVLDQQPIDPVTARDVMRFAHENGICAQLYLGDTVVVEKMNPYTARYIGKNGMHALVEPEVFERLYENVPKILAFSEDEATMRGLFETAFADRVHITRSQSTFIEINDFSATKGRALSRLAERMRLDRSQVAAMGDSYLDIDMIEWAGTGVCMADSVEEVKRVADVIAPEQANDGVAWFIENYILREDNEHVCNRD